MIVSVLLILWLGPNSEENALSIPSLFNSCWGITWSGKRNLQLILFFLEWFDYFFTFFGRFSFSVVTGILISIKSLTFANTFLNRGLCYMFCSRLLFLTLWMTSFLREADIVEMCRIQRLIFLLLVGWLSLFIPCKNTRLMLHYEWMHATVFPCCELETSTRPTFACNETVILSHSTLHIECSYATTSTRLDVCLYV